MLGLTPALAPLTGRLEEIRALLGSKFPVIAGSNESMHPAAQKPGGE